jgi:glutamate racemase
MIGILDSGLGGYTIFNALHHAYPEAAFWFLADQINAPYGNKTPAQIQAIAQRNVTWFVKQGITHIVIACNTINAVALNTLIQDNPAVTFYDVLSPTLAQLDGHAIKSWLIVGTQRTIESGLYQNALAQKSPQLTIQALALPELVQMIEDLSDEATVRSYLQNKLADVQPTEGLILACTHYPLVAQAFEAVVPSVQIDSIDPMVERFRQTNLPLGPSRCFTTGDPQHSQTQVRALFNHEQGFSQVSIP